MEGLGWATAQGLQGRQAPKVHVEITLFTCKGLKRGRCRILAQGGRVSKPIFYKRIDNLVLEVILLLWLVLSLRLRYFRWLESKVTFFSFYITNQMRLKIEDYISKSAILDVELIFALERQRGYRCGAGLYTLCVI